MGKAQIKAAIWLALLPACCGCTLALDPSLDVSQYAHTSWKIREGFATGTIHEIVQTPDGYLWLATESGLLRFDGARTVNWQPPPGESLPSNDIRDAMAGRDGTLWLGTAKGLASWKDGKLTHYPELAGRDVGTLLEDHEGTVWASGTNWEAGFSAPAQLCAIKGRNIHCYGSEGTFGFGVTDAYEDSQGNVWLGAANGIWRWKPGPPIHYPAPALMQSGLPGLIFARHALVADGHGGLLVSGYRGIWHVADGKVEPYRFPSPPPQFREAKLLRDRDGGLWIGTLDAGLLHVHQGRMDVYTTADGLSGNSVESLFEDREGNIWVATIDGVDRFRNYAIPTISVKQGLSSSVVVCILAAQDGSVWLGTSDGLDRWKDGQVTTYYNPAVERGAVLAGRGLAHEPGVNVREVASAELPDNYVGSLYQDTQGRIWISTLQGLAYFEDGRITRLGDTHLKSLSPIAGDRAGNLWVTNSDQGLFRLREGKVVEQFPWASLGLGGSLSMPLATDRHDGLWLGSWNGGVSYFRDGRARASYTAKDGLGAGRVNSLKLDPDDTVWVATDSGLSRIKDGHVTTLTSRNGLPCDSVHDLIDDETGSLWVYLACGLVRIPRSELEAWAEDPVRRIQTTVFYTSDGVRSHAGVYNFGPRAARTPDGKLWFLPLDGVSVVDPRHLSYNKFAPPVHIEQLTANGKVYDLSVIGKGRLQLPPRLHDLSINYTALTFVAPEKVHFRFMLEGQDKDWRGVINQRRVEYSNLPPRNYRFRVMACNNSGVWNEEGAFLDFSIAPAYYQTNWFRALCVLTFLAMLWTAYQLRVRALEGRQAEIRALNEQLVKAQEAERIRISGELHDGVLQQITSLTLRLGTVKREVPPESKTKEKISGLQQQLIKIGTDIRHLSHELHPALLQEAGLPAALSAYCEEFSNVRGLPVSCETDEAVRELSPGAALCLYRIAQEALGNAAKHSEAKQMEVRLTRSDGRVWLSVSDDGVGCFPDQVGKSGGLGLINMRERVLQLDGTFAFDSEPGRGTTVRVTVPFRANS